MIKYTQTFEAKKPRMLHSKYKYTNIMRNYFFCFFLLFACIHETAMAQKKGFKFGKIDIKNLQLATCPLDSNAGAMVIFDKGNSFFNSSFDLVYQRHIRIKIFDESEFDQGDIEIKTYNKSAVANFQAVTYNLENGKIVESKVSKKNIYTEENNKYFQTKKFSFPDLKKGSIIEFKYSTELGSAFALNTWYFQHDIPSLYSEYEIRYPKFIDYKIISSGYVPMFDVKNASVSVVMDGQPTINHLKNWKAKNIPAFIEEPYMASSRDYISSLRFEIASIEIPGRVYETYLPDSYSALSKQLALEENGIGYDIKRSGYYKKDMERLLNAPSEVEKMKNIYYFLQKKLQLDDDFDGEGPKQTYIAGRGSDRMINAILTSMLKTAGFEAYIVYLSKRNRGKLHPFYAFRQQFNHTAVLVRYNNEEILLDASDKSLPFGVLPYSSLNDKGLVVSSNSLVWVDLAPNFKETETLSAQLTFEDDVLTGDISYTFKGYNALSRISQVRVKGESVFKEKYMEENSEWDIHALELVEMSKEKSIFKQKANATTEGASEFLGNIIYLSACPVNPIKENPFKLENRVYPVEFSVPFAKTKIFTIKIPEGFDVDEMPKPISMSMPDGTGKFLYNIQKMNGAVQVYMKFEIKKSMYTQIEYPALKEFYGQVINKLNEQIVLKRSL